MNLLVLAFNVTVGARTLDVSQILTIPDSPVKTAVRIFVSIVHYPIIAHGRLLSAPPTAPTPPLKSPSAIITSHASAVSLPSHLYTAAKPACSIS